jgi:ferrochelatase
MAVLLMAYGSPRTIEEIEPYYTHIRGGRKPSNEEIDDLKRRYAAIGGVSPLLKITQSTASKLENRFRSRPERAEIRVFAGMKHSKPFISEVMKQMASEGITKILAVALAPHFSRMSIGGYQDAVKRANEELRNQMELHFVDQWYNNRLFVEKWAKRIKEARQKYFAGEKSVFHLFTAHSLPERILSWGDPYRDQLYESAGSIASFLALKEEEFGFAFQSAGHTSEPWFGPDILDKIKTLRGERGEKTYSRNVLIAPIGFVSDHLEILYDIDIEAKNLARELGIKLERTSSFNDSDDLLDILESVIEGSGFLAKEETPKQLSSL